MSDPNLKDPNLNADGTPRNPNRREPNRAHSSDPNRREPTAREPTARESQAASGAEQANPGGGAPKRRRSRRRSRSGRGRANENAQNQPDKPAGGAAGGANATEPALTLADSLQAAVLRHTSAAVLSRGRGYAKRNRVSELRISAGKVRARVHGSEDQRYRVELSVPQRPAPAIVTKIRWSCDCPYAAEHRRGTCKHVVAVALVVSKRLERTESMRRRWLGQPAANAAEAEPAEFDALAERLLEAFTAEPVSVEAVLNRALAIAPPPFEVPANLL